MKTADKARFIRQALSSNHFQGFWPGADNKRAISTATSGSGGWGGPSGWGQLTKNGIETYPSLDDLRAGTNGDCIPWREIIDVIRRGLTPENRERYEAASAAHFEQSRTPLPEPRTIGVRSFESGEPDPYFESEANQAHWARNSAVIRDLDDATIAILTEGLDRQPIQAGLW